MIRIVADADIPGLAQVLRGTGQLELISGSRISADNVRDADILLVRSVTRVDRRLLEGSSVRLVGSATAGVDHIDVDYLRQKGIEFRHTPGANAESVVEYVLAALFALAAAEDRPLRAKTIGIIGFGNVGSRLAPRVRAAGMRVLVNDPPLASSASNFAAGYETTDLVRAVRESDVLTLHVPLESGGSHPTRHLVTDELMASMKPGSWLLNTSRGAVVDQSALLAHMAGSAAGLVVLDVWESEPEPSPSLLAACRLGTPHVAGYSLDAKLAATRRIALEVLNFVGAPEEKLEADALERWLRPPSDEHSEVGWYHFLVRQMFDIEGESERFRRAMLETNAPGRVFALHRRDHMSRRSFRRYLIRREQVPERFTRVGDVLGVGVRRGGDQS